MNTRSQHNWVDPKYEKALDFMAKQWSEVEQLRKREIPLRWRSREFKFDMHQFEESKLIKSWMEKCGDENVDRLVYTVRKRRYGKPPLKAIGFVGDTKVFVCYLPLPGGGSLPSPEVAGRQVRVHDPYDPQSGYHSSMYHYDSDSDSDSYSSFSRRGSSFYPANMSYNGLTGGSGRRSPSTWTGPSINSWMASATRPSILSRFPRY